MRVSIHDRKALNGILAQDCIRACGPPTGYPNPEAWQTAIYNMQRQAVHAANKAYERFLGINNKYLKPHQGPKECERRRAQRGIHP